MPPKKGKEIPADLTVFDQLFDYSLLTYMDELVGKFIVDYFGITQVDSGKIAIAAYWYCSYTPDKEQAAFRAISYYKFVAKMYRYLSTHFDDAVLRSLSTFYGQLLFFKLCKTISKNRPGLFPPSLIDTDNMYLRIFVLFGNLGVEGQVRIIRTYGLDGIHLIFYENLYSAFEFIPRMPTMEIHINGDLYLKYGDREFEKFLDTADAERHKLEDFNNVKWSDSKLKKIVTMARVRDYFRHQAHLYPYMHNDASTLIAEDDYSRVVKKPVQDSGLWGFAGLVDPTDVDNTGFPDFVKLYKPLEHINTVLSDIASVAGIDAVPEMDFGKFVKIGNNPSITVYSEDTVSALKTRKHAHTMLGFSDGRIRFFEKKKGDVGYYSPSVRLWASIQLRILHDVDILGLAVPAEIRLGFTGVEPGWRNVSPFSGKLNLEIPMIRNIEKSAYTDRVHSSLWPKFPEFIRKVFAATLSSLRLNELDDDQLAHMETSLKRYPFSISLKDFNTNLLPVYMIPAFKGDYFMTPLGFSDSVSTNSDWVLNIVRVATQIDFFQKLSNIKKISTIEEGMSQLRELIVPTLEGIKATIADNLQNKQIRARLQQQQEEARRKEEEKKIRLEKERARKEEEEKERKKREEEARHNLFNPTISLSELGGGGASMPSCLAFDSSMPCNVSLICVFTCFVSTPAIFAVSAIVLAMLACCSC